MSDIPNYLRLLNEAAIHFESFPGGRDGNGMALLYRAIDEIKDRSGRCLRCGLKVTLAERGRTIPDTECLDCGQLKSECPDDCPRVRANGGKRERPSERDSP